MNDATIRSVCLQRFEFLYSEFGISERDLSKTWGMTFRSSVSMVWLEFDRRRNWLYVDVVDPDPRQPKQYAAMSLTSIVAYYCKYELKLVFRPRILLNEVDHLDWMASESAKVLKRFASHMLKGDFTDAQKIFEHSMRCAINDAAMSRDKTGTEYARYAREHPIGFTSLFEFRQSADH